MVKANFTKAVNLVVDNTYLKKRENVLKDLGYHRAKWVFFCEVMLKLGMTVSLYEARQTVSKYITVKKDDKQFTVRFSNHAPGYRREQNGDCDFFVGRNNFSITTTGQAILATREYFNI